MTTLRNDTIEVSKTAHDSLTGRGDPQQRFRVYRLCVCFQCQGEGKVAVSATLPNTAVRISHARCDECRGEGKVLDLVATCPDPQALGVTLVELAREGEFDGCPVGVLEDGGNWLIKPWLPSPRNVTDAARVLAKAKTKGESVGDTG